MVTAFKNWDWNRDDADLMCKWISENQIRTVVKLEHAADGDVIYYFQFIFGDLENPAVVHKVSFPQSEVFSKYSGNLGEAMLYYESREYYFFKEKIRKSVEHDMGLGESPIDDANTINKKK